MTLRDNITDEKRRAHNPAAGRYYGCATCAHGCDKGQWCYFPSYPEIRLNARETRIMRHKTGVCGDGTMHKYQGLSLYESPTN